MTVPPLSTLVALAPNKVICGVCTAVTVTGVPVAVAVTPLIVLTQVIP
jgi:hypothetical protein